MEADCIAHIIVQQYIDMLKDVGFTGFIMIELRKNGDNFYMIEANPRFWGPSQLFCDSGMNFFEFFLHDFGYLSKLPKHTIDYHAKYLWSGGVKGKITVDDNCVWYEGGREYFIDHKQKFLSCDIYCRDDTIEIYKMEGKENKYDK